jgi:hypothetical protein
VVTVEERHVFVTASGAPRRAARLVATAVTLAIAAWLALLVVGSTGFGALPPLGRVLAVRGSLLRHHLTALAAYRARPLGSVRFEHRRPRVGT